MKHRIVTILYTVIVLDGTQPSTSTAQLPGDGRESRRRRHSGKQLYANICACKFLNLLRGLALARKTAWKPYCEIQYRRTTYFYNDFIMLSYNNEIASHNRYTLSFLRLLTKNSGWTDKHWATASRIRSRTKINSIRFSFGCCLSRRFFLLGPASLVEKIW